MNRLWIAVVGILASCTGQQQNEVLVQNVGFAQGSTYNVQYMSTNAVDYQWEVDSILVEMDSSLSTYQDYSLISKLNQGDTTIFLDEHFVKVFKAFQSVADSTQGKFDCTLAPIVNVWGFGFTEKTKVDSSLIQSLLQKVGYQKVSLKGDTAKPFSIGIKDIDESIMFYFKNVIKPFVIQNGQRLAVPIMYGAPERWKSVQRDGFMRDQKNKIMAPMIMFKRNTITPLRNVTNKLDANRPVNLEYFQSKYSKNNFYDKFNILNKRQPVKQNYAVVVPEFMEITYSCMMYTYYVEQLNKIIEAVQYAQNSYWGDPERFKFKATIDSFATVTELSEGSERTVRANFDLKLYGHIIPDTIQKDLTVDKKVFTKAQIVTSTETVVNLNDLNDAQINQPIDINNPNNTDVNVS